MFRAIAAATVLFAAPPLTTIQDLVYKADGSPFTGILFIEAYTVRYNSDGKIQFEELWAVPPSAAPLRLKDVRIAGPISGPVTPPPVESIEESDVIGLVNDLAIRPVKGPGYAPSRAVYVDASGALEAVIGNLTDCVRVDGTAGPCGSAPTFVDGETPGGAIDGANASFTLAGTPAPASSLTLYRNGLFQKPGVDYILSESTITFLPGALPQPGDVLAASYRLDGTGVIGGGLELGMISDANVSELAGIRESKLALNYPTHSNANDPSADEKAALAGTAGAPSASNRFVTHQDARLADARTPTPHGLLSIAHNDAAAATPARGDLVVAQGASPAQWARLPIGPANRCLVSNGVDAQWNTCLFTGFAAGAVPFADASGNLAQNVSRLVWDNTNRKLSVGNNSGTATLYLYDGQPATGVTELTVRAGQGQGVGALQRWLDASGTEVARVEANGRFAGASFRGATSGSRAAWQDSGAAADPSPRADGDTWFNTAAQAHKGAHLGQAHPVPQVICSATGTSTSSTALERLGSCTFPAYLLKPGDRVDIRFDYAHAGASSDFSFDVRWGGTSLVARTAALSETAAGGRVEAAIHAGGAQWRVESWGASLAFAASAGTTSDALSAPLTIDLLGRVLSGGSDIVTLRGFTVVRYPAQQNP